MTKDIMLLLKMVLITYRVFLKHPEFRGPKFHWLVPARLAYQDWKMLR
jgi:hypothetical protein